MSSLNLIKHTHDQSLTQIMLRPHTDIQEHIFFSTALQFYQYNSLIAQELHYLSQQGAGNIIVSKGIKATASLLRRFIHTQYLSLSLSLS